MGRKNCSLNIFIFVDSFVFGLTRFDLSFLSIGRSVLVSQYLLRPLMIIARDKGMKYDKGPKICSRQIRFLRQAAQTGHFK